MNRDEIRNVLLELAGNGLLPDRGVGADDILLSHLSALDDEARVLFWSDVGGVLREIWSQENVGAVSNVAVFISRIPQSARPTGAEAEQVASFLLDDVKLKDTIWKSIDELRLIIAALRMLSALALGGRIWWLTRFHSWLQQVKVRKESEALYAWQAVLHASRGLFNSGEIAPNFDAWFHTAQAVNDFPAMEIFTLLADQMASPTADKDAIKNEVLADYQSLYARCFNNASCPEGIEDLKAVIESWLEDRVGMSDQEASELLKWKEPERKTPSARFNELAVNTSYGSPA